ncbi:MAG: hypothetical protein SFY67_14620 [Candidatus Melainabacteria bacterium]|nr:hypothetical protein [Candidatus Melainabacteria bacterium]
MENPNDKEKLKEQARKNIFSGRLKIGLAIVGVIFILQGLNQMNKGFKEIKDSSSVAEVAPQAGSDYSQVGPQYKDANSSLTLNYPSDWAIGANPTPTNPFQASGQGGVVDYRISKEPLNQDITPKQYLDAMDKIFKTDPKIKSMTPFSENAININGNEGLTREHTMILTGKDIILKQKLLILVKDRNAYCAVSTTPVNLYEKTKPTFEAVNQTIRFE